MIRLGGVLDAQAERETDGEFVNGCSDALNRPTPDRVRELVVEWGELYPEFGTVGALDMVNCLAWPSGSSDTATGSRCDATKASATATPTPGSC